MSAVLALSVFFILINYKITLINSVAASEANYFPIERSQAMNVDVVTETVGSCDCEEVFVSPIKVIYDGTVSGVFVGGQDISVEVQGSIANNYINTYVITPNGYIGEMDQLLRISGRGVGTTCAYASSLGNQCSLEVIADIIEFLE